MSFSRKYLTDFRVLSWGAFGLMLLFILATGLTIWTLRSDAIRDADNDSGNLAVVLGGQIARSIQSVDIILSDVRDQTKAHISQDPRHTAETINSHESYNALLAHLTRLSQADVIALIDGNGRVANSTTQWPPTGTYVGDRDYFQHFKNNNDKNIFISSLQNRVSGVNTIFFSRRISGPDGDFRGLVLIGLRLSYFEGIYQTITPLLDQSFLLLHVDGTVLARYPDAVDRSNQKMPADSPWYRLVASGGGNYRSPGYFDNAARYVSVRPLHDYPLVVNIAVTETAALANWKRQAISIGIGVFIAMIGWAFLLRLSHNQFRRLFESETELKSLAHYDQLTELPNRVSLHNDLNHAIGSSGSAANACIAIFDLDHFKDINDTLGHSIGDLLLQAVAARLKEHSADTRRFYRLGGDEFVLIQRECRDPLEIGEIVDRVLRRLTEIFDINQHQLFIGASAGIAIAPGDGTNIEELISNADLALYEAKGAGGNAYRLFMPAMRAKTIARRGLDAELRRASENKEFELFFQPQIRTSDGMIVGAEALLRWRHPSRGILAPGAFIGALGTSAVVLDVGRWILRQACEQAAAWRQAGLPSLRIAVNLFPAQFRSDTLVDNIDAALRDSGLPADALEIEITEDIALNQEEQSLEALRVLRTKGIKIAFDDFGTGYASLSSLARYPLTRLKIDQTFVRQITARSTPEDTAIVRSIIVMAHNLGLEVVAEGVETAAQATFLRTEGCDELQGYFFAKPLSARDFEAYVLNAQNQSPRDAVEVLAS